MGTLPVFRWRLDPEGLATRRQLRAAGLRAALAKETTYPTPAPAPVLARAAL